MRISEVGAQRGGERDGRGVAAVAPQRGDVEAVRGSLEADDDHDPPGVELALDARGVDAGDAGESVRMPACGPLRPIASLPSSCSAIDGRDDGDDAVAGLGAGADAARDALQYL